MTKLKELPPFLAGLPKPTVESIQKFTSSLEKKKKLSIKVNVNLVCLSDSECKPFKRRRKKITSLNKEQSSRKLPDFSQVLNTVDAKDKDRVETYLKFVATKEIRLVITEFYNKRNKRKADLFSIGLLEYNKQFMNLVNQKKIEESEVSPVMVQMTHLYEDLIMETVNELDNNLQPLREKILNSHSGTTLDKALEELSKLVEENKKIQLMINTYRASYVINRYLLVGKLQMERGEIPRNTTTYKHGVFSDVFYKKKQELENKLKELVSLKEEIELIGERVGCLGFQPQTVKKEFNIFGVFSWKYCGLFFHRHGVKSEDLRDFYETKEEDVPVRSIEDFRAYWKNIKSCSGNSTKSAQKV